MRASRHRDVTAMRRPPHHTRDLPAVPVYLDLAPANEQRRVRAVTDIRSKLFGQIRWRDGSHPTDAELVAALDEVVADD